MLPVALKSSETRAIMLLFSRDLKQPTAKFYKPIDSSSRRPPLGSADVGVHSGKCFANRVSFDLYAAGFCWIT
jgi:hypothetical protein